MTDGLDSPQSGDFEVFDVGIAWLLQLIEERQQSMVRSKLSGLGVNEYRLGKDLLLQGQVGIKIDLSGLNGFVSKPK
jgi:hypothetical protein